MARTSASANSALWPMKPVHALLWQGVVVVVVLGALLWFGHNAATHLARRNMELDFGFLWRPAGFAMPFQMTTFKPTDSYFMALVAAFSNTLLVSSLGIAAATVLGLALGVMRLSSSWLMRTASSAVVELIRNTPQLLQVVFWYIGVLQLLPQARQGFSLAGLLHLNIRGLFVPAPLAGAWTSVWMAILLASLIVVPMLRRWLPLKRKYSGWLWLLPWAFAAALVDSLAGWSIPSLRGFNFVGGMVMPPELVALWAGLSLYSAAFIAEIVRKARASTAYCAPLSGCLYLSPRTWRRSSAPVCRASTRVNMRHQPRSGSVMRVRIG